MSWALSCWVMRRPHFTARAVRAVVLERCRLPTTSVSPVMLPVARSPRTSASPTGGFICVPSGWSERRRIASERALDGGDGELRKRRCYRVSALPNCTST